MRNRDAFSSLHPLVNFLFFALVLVFSAFLMHPLVLSVSLVCAVCYHLYLCGRKALRMQLCMLLPMMLMAALVNPAFNHEGATILAYLPSGNPLTQESVLYGLAAAAMLAAVVLWFACYSQIMTSDKFVYLFGRVIPALSLVLSMTLRFVPKFKARFLAVSEAQQCIGRDASGKSIFRRIHNAVTVLSILLTWALESAAETAGSMKSRGYGLPGRTAFSIYRFDRRDKITLLWLGLCGAYVTFGWISDALRFHYYPTVKGAALTPFSVSFPAVFGLLCLTPLILNVREDKKWKKLRSEI